MAGEPVLFDAPELCKSRVEEAEPLVRAVDRDSGMDVFQHLAVRVDVSSEFALGAFEVGAVDGKPDRPAGAVGQFANFEEAARAADDDMPSFALDRSRRRRPSQCPRLLAASFGSQLAAVALHRLAQRIARHGIGIVAVDEPQRPVTPPLRQRYGMKCMSQSGGGSRRGIPAYCRRAL